MLFVKEGDLYGNASTRLIPFALATSCTLEISTDEFDYTSKDSGSWKSSKPGMNSFSMSTNCLYSNEADKLLLLQINRIELDAYWMPAKNIEAENEVTHIASLVADDTVFMCYRGKVWINSFSATADNGAVSNYSVNFTGDGPIVPSNTLPGGGIGVNIPEVMLEQGGVPAEIIVTGATGTLSATTSNAKVTCTFANGVATIGTADDCPYGAYTVTISDSGTGTTAYVFVVVVDAL